eukprot:SAG31_NODE_519_length_14648_cov_24.224895_6_plen_98_part_00
MQTYLAVAKLQPQPARPSGSTITAVIATKCSFVEKQLAEEKIPTGMKSLALLLDCLCCAISSIVCAVRLNRGAAQEIHDRPLCGGMATSEEGGREGT